LVEERDKRVVTEFLKREGKLLPTMVELVERAERATALLADLVARGLDPARRRRPAGPTQEGPGTTGLIDSTQSGMRQKMRRATNQEHAAIALPGARLVRRDRERLPPNHRA